MKIAERIARENKFHNITVISGEGVKEYYEKAGYKEIDTYMIKDLNSNMLYINSYYFPYKYLYDNIFWIIKNISNTFIIYVLCKYIVFI